MSKQGILSKLWRGRIICVVVVLLVMGLSASGTQAVQLTIFSSPPGGPSGPSASTIWYAGGERWGFP